MDWDPRRGTRRIVILSICITIVLICASLGYSAHPYQHQPTPFDDRPDVTFECYQATITLDQQATVTIFYPEGTSSRTLPPGTHTVRGRGAHTGKGIATITIRIGNDTWAYRNPNYPQCDRSTTTTTTATTTTTTSIATPTTTPIGTTAAAETTTATTSTETPPFPVTTTETATSTRTRVTTQTRTMVGTERGAGTETETVARAETPQPTSEIQSPTPAPAPATTQKTERETDEESELETTRQATSSFHPTGSRGDGQRPDPPTSTPTPAPSQPADSETSTTWTPDRNLQNLGIFAGLLGIGAGMAIGMSSRARTRVKEWADHVGAVLPFELPTLTEREEDVLTSHTRRDVWRVISENPGLSQTEIVERVDVKRGSVRRHLRKLREADMVIPIRIGRSVRYVPRGLENPKGYAVLRDATLQAVVTEIGDAGGNVTNSRLADELDGTPSSISRHLRRLEEAGLVETEYEGRESDVTLTAQGWFRYFAL